MSAKQLLIDAGNTRLKWALREAGDWVAQGHGDYSDWSGLRQILPEAARCHVASVASASRTGELEALLRQAGVPTVWLRAEARFGDVVNGYADPHQLGVDRWMGLIAARARTRDAVLVASAGTALTVDALAADGRFLGGVIVPGLQLMRQALRAGTAGVEPAGGRVMPFPITTADAVESGLVAALSGTILQQHARLAEATGQAPRCLLTGGDAGVLAPWLEGTFEIVPALVLEGIARVANEEKSE
ncbi:MAG: type III pantothenate kinase [Gammaproteobacteria bacterium]